VSNQTNFTAKDFWKKVARVPRNAGFDVIEKAVTLYVLLVEGGLPLWCRGSIVACLVYFLSPLDLVPDFAPGGFCDDFAAMTLLLAELHGYLTPSLRQRIEDLIPKKCRRLET